MKEKQLRRLVREELVRLNEAKGFEDLRNTSVTLRPSMDEEHVEYQRLWPLVKAMKRNDVFIGDWVITTESHERNDSVPTEADIVGFEIRGNAADVLFGLRQLSGDARIQRPGDLGKEKGKFYVESVSDLPSMWLKVTDVSGEIKDTHGYNARGKVVQQFERELF